MIQIRDFTVPELDKFRELCNFTPQERLYFELKAKDKSNIEISFDLKKKEKHYSNVWINFRDSNLMGEIYSLPILWRRLWI